MAFGAALGRGILGGIEGGAVVQIGQLKEKAKVAREDSLLRMGQEFQTGQAETLAAAKLKAEKTKATARGEEFKTETELKREELEGTQKYRVGMLAKGTEVKFPSEVYGRAYNKAQDRWDSIDDDEKELMLREAPEGTTKNELRDMYAQSQAAKAIGGGERWFGPPSTGGAAVPPPRGDGLNKERLADAIIANDPKAIQSLEILRVKDPDAFTDVNRLVKNRRPPISTKGGQRPATQRRGVLGRAIPEAAERIFGGGRLPMQLEPEEAVSERQRQAASIYR